MKKYEKLIHNILIFFLITSTMFSLLISLEIFITLKLYSIFLIIMGIIYIGLIIFGISKKYYKLSIFDYLIVVLILFEIVSCIFSLDIDTSIFGLASRREGLLVIISYYLAFLISRKISNNEYS